VYEMRIRRTLDLDNGLDMSLV